MDISLSEATELVRTIGPLGMLLFFGFGFLKKWWVLGWTYEEMQTVLRQDCHRLREESIRWRELFLSGLTMTEEAVDHLTKQRK